MKPVNYNTPSLVVFIILISCYPTDAFAHGEQIFPFMISWGIISTVMICLMSFIKIALYVRIMMILAFGLSTIILFFVPLDNLLPVPETALKPYWHLFWTYPVIAPILQVGLASVPPFLIYLIAKAKQAVTKASLLPK